MFHKIIKQERNVEDKNFRENPQEILNALRGIEHDPSINKKANYYAFREKYAEKSVDLDAWYADHKVTSTRDSVQNNFLHNKHNELSAELAESLPLYANKPGRLGDYLEVNVMKTARQDDQGNSFIDLVLEVRNKWLATDAPASLQDSPERMTFLIDMTTADGDSLHHKEEALREVYLKTGALANVKCYETRTGELGINKPRLVIHQEVGRIKRVGQSLGECITQLASDKFSINRPESFDKAYRVYFGDLMVAIQENAATNSAYIKSLPADPKRAALAKEYDKIVKFIEAYKKTPVTKSHKS